MAGSPKFARIQREVLLIVEAIPPGKVSTFQDIGQALDVMPRHVAYILAMLPDNLRSTVPWHRVVGEGGVLKATKQRSAAQQKGLLASEGAIFTAAGAVDLEKCLQSLD